MGGQEAIMKGLTLTIPGMPPMSLNVYLRKHWSVRGQTKRFWTMAVWGAAIEAMEQLPGMALVDLQHRRRHKKVRLDYYFPTVRRRDRDNYQKILLDALVANKLLVDDSPEWCEVTVEMHVDAERPRTEIRLEEVVEKCG